MSGLTDSLISWIINLVLPSSIVEDVLFNEPLLFSIFFFTAIVLVLMTVSFLFKFILKLVDR